MRKYLHNFTYIKYPLLCLLFVCNTSGVTFSQNIKLKVERLGLQIYQPASGEVSSLGTPPSQDCAGFFSFPEPIINNKLTISGIDYQLPEFNQDEFGWYLTNVYSVNRRLYVCGWLYNGYKYTETSYYSGSSSDMPYVDVYALWYQNNNFNTSSNIDVQLAAYEDDNALCGDNDAWCGGWNTIRTLADIPNSVSPCGQEFKDSIFCTSDGSSRWWGIHYKVSWQWVALFEDGIDDVKDVCVGSDHVNVYTQIYGTLQNVNYQWQKSTDANNWTNISGNDVFASVDLSAYNTTMNLYVRKVKKGIACNGFSTPADEYSNICIIRIRPNPSIAPTATRAPAATNTCEATLTNPTGVQYDGLISYTMEYQTSYDGGLTWSAIQNTIPTLINNTNATINNAKIRLRANYTTLSNCSDSPWREYSWNLYAQTVEPIASSIYPTTVGYTCSSDSMSIIFNAGYGGGPSAVDDLDYTTDGGTTWLAYTSGQKIPTPGGAGLSYGIRARRIATLTTNCSNTPFTYYGYWTPYRPTTSPTLGAKTPNVAGFCKGSYANVSATIFSGSFGVPGQAANQYQYSIDAGNTWQTYTSGANISTTNAVDSIYIRVRRVDGNPIANAIGPCSSDWTIIAAWRIIDPICNFTATSSYCYNPSAPYVEIRAVRPSPGIGTWSIASGSGSLSSTTAQNTQLTGLTVGSPTRIRWSVTESGCTKIKNLDINPAAVSPSNITDGGVCQICPVKNSGTFKFFDNNGKLIAKIEDAVSPTIELGNTEVCAAIDPSVQNIIDDNGNVQPYLQRHFSIKPTTNTTSNVTLYFTATEFNNLKSSCNATQYAFTNVNQLIVSKFPNGGNNVYTLPNTNGATYIIPTASGLDANGYYFLTIPVSTYSTFYIHSTNGLPAVLPIELTYFTAACEDDKVNIEWQTASEFNNHHFEVERSENGVDFKNIISVPSQNGNINRLQDYTVFDKELAKSITYYRLKQIDMDSSFSYSKMISLNCFTTSEVTTDVAVYPNPINDLLILFVNAERSDDVTFRIYDINSAVLIQQQFKVEKGNNKFNVITTGLASGLYFIEVSNMNQVLFRNKIIKQ